MVVVVRILVSILVIPIDTRRFCITYVPPLRSNHETDACIFTVDVKRERERKARLIDVNHVLVA